MPSEDTKILEFNQYQKSDKAPVIIHADLEYNPENSFTTKLSTHIPSGFPMSEIPSLRTTENNHDVNRGKDCMKRFCQFLREHAMKIFNFEKKKNKVINKRTTWIIWKPKNLLYL